MIRALLLSLLTGVIWGLVGVCFGKAPSDKKMLWSFFAIQSAFYFSASLLTLKFQKPELLPLLKLAAVLLPASIADLTAFYLLKKAMELGPQSIGWSVFQSCLVLPFFLSQLLPGVHAGVWAWLGVAALLAGLAAMTRSKAAGPNSGSGNRRYWLILWIAFLLAGTSQFLRLLPNFLNLPESILSWRLVLGAFLAVSFWNGTVLLRKAYRWRGVWKNAILYGIIVLAGQYTFYQAADAAALCHWSSAVFPVAIGTCIVLFSLYCAIFRREKLAFYGWTGILLIVLGITGLSI